jgi:hypothetical protein
MQDSPSNPGNPVSGISCSGGAEIAGEVTRLAHAHHPMATFVHSVVDAHVSLHRAHKVVEVFTHLGGVVRHSFAIEPGHPDIPEFSEQFVELGLHIVLNVVRECRVYVGAASFLIVVGFPNGLSLRMMLIYDRVEDAQFDSVRGAGPGGWFKEILLVAGGLTDIPVAHL